MILITKQNMKRDSISQYYSNWQTFSLTFLRILIGWHFLYEGLSKLFSIPAWSAKSYLLGSVGPFAMLFRSIGNSETILNITDLLNIWGLILIGFSLFIGLFSKTSTILGMILILFYYLAYPPFAQLGINTHVEGSYWIVNKNLIEIAAMLILYLFPSSHISGFDRYFYNKTKKNEN
jgi:thiosulfate dehydrogenase (quinone) large subunit